ncbi:uncharacterized protein LOC108628194 isoform X2 [Ceratina calcarata]|uniref:Uncharacterized protein LOC108628194 isoform X2 n=1 Tax=Ceratina calcarata TaxID=156304 RepID=A0AAJ7J6P6_9HYME|nr:uncharacterized protein LOC108628194 isoform X2 [Ceratina calcarata]
MKRLLVYSIACLILKSFACDNCCEINSRRLPYYKLMKSHARSNQFILASAVVQTVNECRKFALTKRALAFNYGLEMKHHGNKVTRKICEALQCPEVHNFTALEKNRNYKYYSTYPSFIPVTGSSFTLACIPRTGMFVFSSNNLNYSQAQNACQKMNASLAHIISEERTNGLAKYISLNIPAFVGLSKRDNDKFWTNEFNETLSCFNYRAWGKGEPTHSKGCVGLVQPIKSQPGPFWKVISCDSTLSFICEIPPTYR